MFMEAKKGNRNKRGQRGFILIATIMVISLLTILVIAAAVVSQIEQQSAYNTSQMTLAQQNALFAANQALARLQESAGPDQRVTARADIVSPNNSIVPTIRGYSANQPSTDSGQTFWTGVWRNTMNFEATAPGKPQ